MADKSLQDRGCWLWRAPCKLCSLGREVPRRAAVTEVTMKPVSELLRQRQGTLRTVRPDVSVFDALKLLAEYEVGALVVMGA